MDRAELKGLSRTRLSEAVVLLEAGQYAGAYYLAGYAVECALKACIARKTRRYDFPDRKRAQDSWTHDLTLLIQTAGLQLLLETEMRDDVKSGLNWSIVKERREISRYGSFGEAQ